MQKSKVKIITKNRTAGYTLIEILVVIVILLTVGGMAVSILTTSLRGTTKANTIISVKETGNFALSYMANTIRFARGFQVPAGGASQCVTQPTPTTFNSITITASDGAQITFTCDNTNSRITSATSLNGTPAPTASLIDSTPAVVVSSSCYFTCNQLSSSDYPAIGINFTLIPKAQLTPGILVENSSTPILFQTTVVMRNINNLTHLQFPKDM